MMKPIYNLRKKLIYHGVRGAAGKCHGIADVGDEDRDDVGNKYED